MTTDQWKVEFEVLVEPFTVDPERLRTVVWKTMRRFRERGATINITIVDDAQMKNVHKEFLKDADTTDVMSFDLTDEFGRGRLFELVVNAETAARQAAARGHSVEAELALYITHGLLHNLGFDDKTPEAAQKMHAVEDGLLTKLGYGSVFEGR